MNKHKKTISKRSTRGEPMVKITASSTSFGPPTSFSKSREFRGTKSNYGMVSGNHIWSALNERIVRPPLRRYTYPLPGWELPRHSVKCVRSAHTRLSAISNTRVIPSRAFGGGDASLHSKHPAIYRARGVATTVPLQASPRRKLAQSIYIYIYSYTYAYR